MRCRVVRFVDLPWAAAPAAVTAFRSIFHFVLLLSSMFYPLAIWAARVAKGPSRLPPVHAFGNIYSITFDRSRQQLVESSSSLA